MVVRKLKPKYNFSEIYCQNLFFGFYNFAWISKILAHFSQNLPKIGQNAQNLGNRGKNPKIQKTSFVPLIKPNSHAKNHGN